MIGRSKGSVKERRITLVRDVSEAEFLGIPCIDLAVRLAAVRAIKN